MKKFLILSITTILIFTLAVGCDNKKADNVKANTNKEIKKDEALNMFIFKKESLVYENNKSTLITIVTNVSKNVEYLKEFRIHVKDDKNKDIAIISEYVRKNIEPQGSITISSSYDDNLKRAHIIEYEAIR